MIEPSVHSKPPSLLRDKPIQYEVFVIPGRGVRFKNTDFTLIDVNTFSLRTM